MSIHSNPETAKPTILIVDDESIARDILEGHLASEDYTLTSAKNGFQALQHLESQPPDLVLLDIMMPRMDGFEVCQRIKSDERWQHIQVILITSFWDRDQVERGMEVGADGFLQKPVKGDELRSRIRSLLGIK
jgi:CheY-like chemotaxis protein